MVSLLRAGPRAVGEEGRRLQRDQPRRRAGAAGRDDPALAWRPDRPADLYRRRTDRRLRRHGGARPRRQARRHAGARPMSAPFTAGCVQFTAGPDPLPNLRQVGDLVRRARDTGADLIMTPEASNLIESGRRRRDKARREADDPFLAGMRELARELGIWLLLGSLVIDPAGEPGGEGEERLANRSFLIDSKGAIVARY